MRFVLGMVLALAALQGGEPPQWIAGRITNFEESRYLEPRMTYAGMNSCVNRDYTISGGGRTFVGRDSTCYPNAIKAFKVVVNQGKNILGKSRYSGTRALN